MSDWDRDRPTPARLQRLPSWLLSQAAVRSHRLLSDALSAVDASGYHYRLLAALDELGPSSQATLGRSVGMDRRDVTVALTELVARGAVRRAPDPTDSRRNVVRLTSAGAKWLQELDLIVAHVQRELLGSLTGADRKQLVSLLARLQP